MNRTIAACATAGALGASLLLATPAYAAAPSLGNRVHALNYAKAQLGEPYSQANPQGPNHWDCSGLVRAAWAAQGRSLPRVAADQYNKTRHVGKGSRRIGDLVFFRSGGRVYHVGIYAGKDKIVNAQTGSYRGRKVVLAPIKEYAGTVLYGQVK